MPTSERIAACIAAARALDEALSAEAKPIPEGWFTRQQFQEFKGVRRARAVEMIAEMKRLGIVETQDWKIKGGKVPIYRVRA